MLRTMAEPLEEVCSVTRRLLRRRLGLQTSRRVNVFFAAKGRILFEKATYIHTYIHTYTYIYIGRANTSLRTLRIRHLHVSAIIR